MALSDIVTVTITSESAAVEQAGFGVPIILAPDTPGGFTERVRFYTSLTGVGVDFATTTATYKMAAAVFGQNPRPSTLAVGRLANKPTQRWAVTPTASNSTLYQMRVNGTLVEFTSDSSATVTEIITGLKAAIDALSLGVTVSDQTTYMRIVANTAGAFFSVEVLDTSLLALAQDHADPGLATDLAAMPSKTLVGMGCFSALAAKHASTLFRISPKRTKSFISPKRRTCGHHVVGRFRHRWKPDHCRPLEG